MAISVKPGILPYHISDRATLYRSYMPYLKYGGLFVEIDKPYQLGDEIFLLLTLIDEPEKIPIAGEIVWVTPVNAQNNHKAGIGIHFTDNNEFMVTLREKIARYIQEIDASSLTQTM
ncbi:MAG TPA: pilus assembly protein PilZ [Gammaproteobacteria bacterium]|nr:pilus assembly protein PilZ [Gammaproteobacteria bacterium]